MNEPSADDVRALQTLGENLQRLRDEIGVAVHGQHEAIEQLLIALLADGHALLVGVPGLAKTLLVRTLAETLALDFKRIQFTPDLMPADITGTETLHHDPRTDERTFRFLPGPIFANVVLADEINRTPPKTQAALLEAMQERQVTAGGVRHALPQPFFVLATQNPIEQEGTYPLPEAQLDRFMLQILIDYPTADEEFEIVRRTTGEAVAAVRPTLDGGAIRAASALVRRIPIADHLVRFALALVRRTRVGRPGAPDFINRYLDWGAGPRASQHLVLAAKARAALQGRAFVDEADVRAVAPAALRHRLLANYRAEADGVAPDDLTRMLLESTSPATAPQFL
jgi:MoxR-like ATPase